MRGERTSSNLMIRHYFSGGQISTNLNRLHRSGAVACGCVFTERQG